MKAPDKREWIVTRIDGKIASISTDYKLFSAIASKISKSPAGTYADISCRTAGFDEIVQIRKTARWDDIVLFGTPFQKKVWKHLFELTHPDTQGDIAGKAGQGGSAGLSAGFPLISYTDFAQKCGNLSGVRAVAHAVGLNPVAVVIPCHLVVPKESADKIAEIKKKAEDTLFKGDDLYFLDKMDFGEFGLGKEMKRFLIAAEITEFRP